MPKSHAFEIISCAKILQELVSGKQKVNFQEKKKKLMELNLSQRMSNLSIEKNKTRPFI